jgi:PAS domain S-box-containing protein
LFGFAAGESPDWKKLLSTIHPDDREHVQNSVDEALRTGKELVKEFRMVCTDGSARWIASRGRTQFGSNANLQRLMGACVDITDRKRAEEEIKRIRGLEVEMRQVSRTEMMGGLTASLAHELNQPLGAVQLNAETARFFLAAKSPELDKVKAAIDDLIQDNTRAAEIIRNVRALFQLHCRAQLFHHRHASAAHGHDPAAVARQPELSATRHALPGKVPSRSRLHDRRVR